jgi:hypothetical protein
MKTGCPGRLAGKPKIRTSQQDRDCMATVESENPNNAGRQESNHIKVEWLTPTEAIEFLHINRPTLAQLIAENRLRAKCVSLASAAQTGNINTGPKAWTYVETEAQLKMIDPMPTGIQSIEWGMSWTLKNVLSKLDDFIIWAEDIRRISPERLLRTVKACILNTPGLPLRGSCAKMVSCNLPLPTRKMQDPSTPAIDYILEL